MIGDDDIARAFRDIPVPADADERRRRVVDRAMTTRRKRRTRRRTALVACTLSVLAGGGAVAGHVDFQGSLLGRRDQPTGTLDPLLAALPWATNRGGSLRTIDDAPSGTGSLRFAAGTSYPAAATVLLRAVLTTGRLPAGVAQAGPLPRGRVLMRRADGAILLSLVAPFGYDPVTGRVMLPSVSIPGDVPSGDASRIVRAVLRGEGSAVPDATRVSADVAPLAACQVLREGRPATAPCPTVSRTARSPEG